MEILHDLLFNYTLRTVALGTAILGLVSGALGTFALLRKQSLLGDVISHAALPGVVIAFLLTGTRNSSILLIGALIAGWLAAFVVLTIVRHTHLTEDSALGLALSVFFGLGILLLSLTQRLVTTRQAGLDKFLFGQAAALIQSDVITMGVIGIVTLFILGLFWKEFKLVSFDGDFAEVIGFPVQKIELLLTTLFVIAIVIGLQAVGVVLMSAMVVAPAAAARQWTNQLSVMVVLAAFFGALSGVIGAVISASAAGLSTGPVIVLIITIIAVFSLLFAPERGFLWAKIRRLGQRQKLQREMVLSDLRTLALQHNDGRGHPIETLRAMSFGRRSVAHTLKVLESENIVEKIGDLWRLKAWQNVEKSFVDQEVHR